MKTKKVLAVMSVFACVSALALDAVFTDFSYRGEDPLEPCDPATQFRNPIIGGMGPDPAITRKGDDFYLANSSFCYFPGIPIYHSKDLVNWDFCGYVASRVSQMRFKNGIDLSAGVFAPDIKYNPYNDTFYLIVTVIGDRGNVVYKSKDPYQGWSEPIPVPVGGIDPGFFFEDDKTAWIVNNDDAPDGKAEYPGHRTVRIRKYDLTADKCVPGTEKILVNKGVRPEEKPIWCEGPHLYKIDSRYYLMTAEGGTGGWHSEVIWISDRPDGGFKPAPVNPILTQRDLPANRPNPVTAAGHADLFQTPGGDWMAIFLGILPYDANGRHMCNTGRSTFLLPVEWIGEGDSRQPVILPQGKVVPRVLPKRPWQLAAGSGDRPAVPVSGNVVYRDSFASATLDYGWMSLRKPATWAKAGVGGKPGLTLVARPVSLGGRDDPSYLARWVRNMDFTAEITVDFRPAAAGDRAGFTCYQNEKNRYDLAKTLVDGKPAVVLTKSDRGSSSCVAVVPLSGEGPVAMRMTVKGKDISFACRPGGGEWTPVGGVQDGSILSTDHAGGFVAATIGPFAESAAR